MYSASYDIKRRKGLHTVTHTIYDHIIIIYFFQMNLNIDHCKTQYYESSVLVHGTVITMFAQWRFSAATLKPVCLHKMMTQNCEMICRVGSSLHVHNTAILLVSVPVISKHRVFPPASSRLF